MSDMHDQPAQQPRGGPAAAGAGAASQPGTGQPGTGQPGTQAEAGRGYVPRQASGYEEVRTRDDGPSGLALGFTLVAAAFMMVSGLLAFFEGLAAIIRGSFFVVLPNYAFNLSATGWGIIHLILGVLVFAAGVALFADKTWARITGVVLASFSAIANFVFLPYYPVWAIVLIAIDMFIIWALLYPRIRR
ncbi:MAG TPA: hypothetical protein VF223_27630 [Trebonia sp.]